jgi:Ca2+-binding EF-hand superfamily protein
MLDTNKDGGISREEAEKGKMDLLVTNFEDIDTNRDGKLSPQELDNFSDRMSARLAHAPPKPAGQSAKNGDPGPLFIETDKDGNGTLSRDELKAQPELYKDFDKIDTDHNGAITPLEIATFVTAQSRQAQTHQTPPPKTNPGK